MFAHMYMCASGGKKYELFGKFWVRMRFLFWFDEEYLFAKNLWLVDPLLSYPILVSIVIISGITFFKNTLRAVQVLYVSFHFVLLISLHFNFLLFLFLLLFLLHFLSWFKCFSTEQCCRQISDSRLTL